MAGDVGLVAGVVIVSFLGGALFALIAVVAAGVRGEDGSQCADKTGDSQSGSASGAGPQGTWRPAFDD